MAYFYIPVCENCWAEGETESRASAKNANGDFLVRTHCANCGAVISLLRAENRPERRVPKELTTIRTDEYFQQLSAEDLLTEMRGLGTAYFMWQVRREGEEVDPELQKSVERCYKEVYRRITHCEGAVQHGGNDRGQAFLE